MTRNSLGQTASLDVQLHALAFRIETRAASAGGISPFSDLQWIQENVSSFSAISELAELDRDPRTRCDGIVVLNRDAAIYQALVAQRNVYTQVVPCFSMHGNDVATLIKPSAPGIIYDAELEVFYQLAPRFSSTFDPDRGASNPGHLIPIVSVVANENQPSARIAVLRVLREIASQRMHASGWVPLHASAVTAEDRSILILGERRAGKSTLMLQLLLEHDCDFLANDRVWIDASSTDETLVYSTPCIINIRASSLALLNANAQTRAPYLPLCAPLCRTWRARETLDETMANTRTPPPGNQSTDLSLSPRQFLHLVQRNQVSKARATLFLFPTMSDEAGFDIQRLTPKQCETKLRQNLFPITPSIFLESTACDSTFQESLARIAKSIRAFALRVERGRLLSKEDMASVLMSSFR